MSTGVLTARAEGYGDRQALVEGDRASTHRELSQSADRFAVALLARAETRDLAGARVAILSEPGIDWVVATWAVWRAGGIAVPLCVSHPVPELAYVLRDSEPELLLVSPGMAERGRAAAAEVGSVDTVPIEDLVTVEEPATIEEPVTAEDMATVEGTATAEELEVGGDDVLYARHDEPGRGALLVYTSGTTGGPKGVLHTHSSLAAQVDTLLEAWGWCADDRIANVLPLHHVHGIVNVVCCALAAGARCEMMPSFDAETIWERFAARELSVFMAVPTIYSRLLARWEESEDAVRGRWSDGARALRLMVSGSAALPVSVLERWERATGHRLLERYGMTETGMILSNPLDGHRVPGSVGRPLPGVEVRFAGGGEAFPESDDVEARRGELEVRGPALFREYWRREEATREAFTADGWFRTGDVGLLEHGRYRLLGRSSVDILKTGGYKVSALEIEEVLRTHPRIAEVAVVGVQDEEWGQRVGAAVVLRGSADSRGELELEALREWAKERLAPYKVPSLLLVVDELPRNALGKVTKPAVVELFQSD